MSSISSLQLTTPIAGETTYTSPVTDLFRFNSLAYSAFYSHASLAICNLQLYFSTDNETFTLYKEITLDNTITSTGNELIPSRYFRFQIENPAPDAMSLINIQITAHKTSTSNIDVNIGSDDITISGMATETTQLAVKGVLDNIKSNTDNLARVTPTTNVTQAIPVRLMVGTSGSAFNPLRSIGSDLGVYVDDMNVDAVNNSGMAKASLQTAGNNTLTTISNNLITMDSVLDNIKTNTYLLPRVGGVIYSNATTTTGTSTTPIDMGEYNVIQVSGRVPFESSYNFVLQFGRAEVGNYFSDNIQPDIKRLVTTAFATFSLTRTNVAHQFVRLYNLVGCDEVFLEYDLLKN